MGQNKSSTRNRIIGGAVLVAVLSVIVTHNLTWSKAEAQAREQVRQELANKAVAHIVPKLHENVTRVMKESAAHLKEISDRIEKTTWLDNIQPRMERLAELYNRAITQLRSPEINRSAERFLNASYTDVQNEWRLVLDSLRGSRNEDEAMLYLELSQMRSDGSYHLMSALQIMSAALMLEEDGFGEQQ